MAAWTMRTGDKHRFCVSFQILSSTIESETKVEKNTYLFRKFCPNFFEIIKPRFLKEVTKGEHEDKG